MYSPTTRLLTVLEMLQSYKEISGTEIARRLEVDKRSVRRYIVMLQDMGIPIEAERGRNGVYKLQRGFKLPPLMFTETEAVALTLGLLTMREFRFPVDVAAVEGVLAKTERVLPENLLQQARALQEAIIFNMSLPRTRLHSDFLAALSSAVQQRQQLHLRYRSRGGDESERDFDPYGIVFNEGYWYTAGYCHLRQDTRTFRLDRIVALQPGESSFERPKAFDLLGYVMSSIASMPGPYEIEVMMKTTLDHARQFISPDMGTLEPSEKGLIFRRSTLYLEWMVDFLMRLDFPVYVIQPIELSDMLWQTANKALQMIGMETSDQ